MRFCIVPEMYAVVFSANMVLSAFVIILTVTLLVSAAVGLAAVKV